MKIMFKQIDLKKITLLLVLVFVATAAIACFIYFAQYGFNFSSASMFSGDIKGGVKVDEQKTEALQSLNDISIKTVGENINIITSDTDEVKAHFYGSYFSSNKDFKPELTVVRAGDKLEIKVEYKPNIMMFTFRSNLKLDVYIPKQFAGNLESTSTSGEIAADSFTLESFTGKTTSGNLEIKLINAKEANIHTLSGETKINGTYDSFTFKSTSGNLDSTALVSKESIVDSTSGEINIAGTPGDINATSSSGNVDLEYTDFSNKVDIRTTSGEVTLKLPGSAGFNLDYSGTSGDVECAFPITVTGSRADNKLKGTVGSGEGAIKVRTTSGNLNIVK